MTITTALVTILIINGRLIIGSVTFLGGFFRTSWSTGSTPRLKFKYFFIFSFTYFNTNLWAGGPSIMMLIQRICIAFNGFGKWNTVDSVIRLNAAILLKLNRFDQLKFRKKQMKTNVLSWNRTKFRMLWNIAFPSSMEPLKKFDSCWWKFFF